MKSANLLILTATILTKVCCGGLPVKLSCDSWKHIGELKRNLHPISRENTVGSDVSWLVCKIDDSYLNKIDDYYLNLEGFNHIKRTKCEDDEVVTGFDSDKKFCLHYPTLHTEDCEDFVDYTNSFQCPEGKVITHKTTYKQGQKLTCCALMQRSLLKLKQLGRGDHGPVGGFYHYPGLRRLEIEDSMYTREIVRIRRLSRCHENEVITDFRSIYGDFYCSRFEQTTTYNCEEKTGGDLLFCPDDKVMTAQKREYYFGASGFYPYYSFTCCELHRTDSPPFEIYLVRLSNPSGSKNGPICGLHYENERYFWSYCEIVDATYANQMEVHAYPEDACGENEVMVDYADYTAYCSHYANTKTSNCSDEKVTQYFGKDGLKYQCPVTKVLTKTWIVFSFDPSKGGTYYTCCELHQDEPIALGEAETSSKNSKEFHEYFTSISMEDLVIISKTLSDFGYSKEKVKNVLYNLMGGDN